MHAPPLRDGTVDNLSLFAELDVHAARIAFDPRCALTTVSTVGLVTVGFIIGKGGLGELIIDGLDRLYTPEVIVGAVLSVMLALVADALLLLMERALTPWARRRRRVLTYDLGRRVEEVAG